MVIVEVVVVVETRVPCGRKKQKREVEIGEENHAKNTAGQK